MKNFYLLLFGFVFTVSFSSAQTTVSQQWVQFYNGPDSLNDGSFSIDYQGNVYVTGASQVPPFSPQVYKITTIKYSPSGTMLWVATYDSISNASFKAIAMKVDASGNVYVTGSVINNLLNGTTDIVTLKYDSNGNLLWASLYANPLGKQDEPRAIAIDNSGNTYVTGFCSDSATAASSANKDIYTIKYNSAGTQQWAVQYNDSLNLDDVANDIAVDNTGNAYVSGFSYVNSTDRDLVTVKYNASGVQQWIAKYNGGDDDYANKLALDNANSVIVTGASVSTGAEDFITIKYNNAGVQQWVSIHDGAANGSDIAFDIAVDNSNNIIVTGEGDGVGTDDDFITVKYNSSGTQLWVKTFNGTVSGHDAASALSLDTLGNVYITGSSFNTGTDADYTTIKYSPTGIQQWAISFDGVANGPDAATDIKAFANGEIYVTGYSHNGTDYDFATVKYTETTSIPFTVATTTNDATCNGAENGTAGAVASGGTPPYTYQWSNGETTQNIIDLAAGTYTVFVSDSVGATATSIVIINEPAIDTLENPASCSDVFISEYVEGTTHNTALEFFNPTDNPIILNNYFVRVFQNGAPTPLIAQLVGVVAPKQTHTLANPNASSAILAKANQTSNKVIFNGDDAIQLVKVLNPINLNVDSIEGLGQNPHDIFDTLQLDTIDQIGITSVYPGPNGWAVGNSTTKDATLRRNFGVTSGIQDWNCGKEQWKASGQNDISGLGQHQNKCGFVTTHTLSLDSSGNPFRFQNEILVRFKQDQLNNIVIDDKTKKVGVLGEFLKLSAIAILSQKLGFNASSLLCYKVHPRMTSADTVSVTRSGRVIKIAPHFATLGIFLPQTITDSDAITKLYSALSVVDIAEYNYIAHLDLIGTNDPEYINGNSAGLVPTTAIPDANINIEPAWDIETGKQNIKVGIFDCGINWESHDLGDGTLSGSKISDGYDYANEMPISSIASPDSFGHGTACAGIIGALRNNNFAVAGIAGGDIQGLNLGVFFSDMKVFKAYSQDCSTGSFGAPLSAFCQAIVEGAIYNPWTGYGFAQHIQNHSWGGPWLGDSTTLLRECMITAYHNEVALVVSSGNGAYPPPFNPCLVSQYPGQFREHMIFKVGANDSTGARASFSNCGFGLDFIAPGENNLYTSLNNNGDSLIDYFHWGVNDYCSLKINGTSFAAPHAAGVAALIMSYGANTSGLSNSLDADDCQYLMKKYATDITAPPNYAGYDDETGYGRINAGKTMQAIKFPDYQVVHYEKKVLASSAILYASNKQSCIVNNFLGLPNGNVWVNVYKITVTNTHNIPSGYNLIDAWERHAVSNVLGENYGPPGLNSCGTQGNLKYLPDAHFVQLDTFNTFSATLSGYTFEILDSNLNPVGWYPISLSDTATLAYSLHLESQTVDVKEKSIPSIYSVSPNPANTQIKITSNNSIQKFNVEIFNALGERIFSGNNISEISTAQIHPGVYFLKINDDRESKVLKLIINH